MDYTTIASLFLTAHVASGILLLLYIKTDRYPPNRVQDARTQTERLITINIVTLTFLNTDNVHSIITLPIILATAQTYAATIIRIATARKTATPPSKQNRNKN